MRDPACRPGREPRSSSASTQATPRAGPASGSPSRASWPSGWTAGSSCPPSRATPPSSSNCPRTVTAGEAGGRARVVGGLGEEGGSAPGAFYDRLSPGVVTVISIFEDGASLFDEEGTGGQ